MNLASLDMNLIVLLDALLEERSVTRAGSRVGISQPAASNGLQRLRHLLNDEILERDGRHMRLTQRAYLMREPVREALDKLKAALDISTEFDPATTRFQIRIFASDALTFVLLPGLRARLKKLAPLAEMMFVWNLRSKSYELLAEQEIDVALGHYENAPPFVKRELLFLDKIVVQAKSDHPLFTGDVDLERFLSFPRVNVSFEALSFGYVEQALARAGVNKPSEVVLAHLLAAPLATWDTDLITLSGEHLAKRLALMMDIKYCPAPFDVAPLRIEMLWHENSARDPAINWFLEQLRQVAREL